MGLFNIFLPMALEPIRKSLSLFSGWFGLKSQHATGSFPNIETDQNRSVDFYIGIIGINSDLQFQIQPLKTDSSTPIQKRCHDKKRWKFPSWRVVTSCSDFSLNCNLKPRFDCFPCLANMFEWFFLIVLHPLNTKNDGLEFGRYRISFLIGKNVKGLSTVVVVTIGFSGPAGQFRCWFEAHGKYSVRLRHPSERYSGERGGEKGEGSVVLFANFWWWWWMMMMMMKMMMMMMMKMKMKMLRNNHKGYYEWMILFFLESFSQTMNQLTGLNRWVPAVIFESTYWLTEPTALVLCWQVNMKIPAWGEISFD